jgi:hypothetical protein
LKSSPNVVTVPRLGLFEDGFTDAMVTRPRSTSPGRTGLSQRSSSTPADPRLAASSNSPRTSRPM